ncbi:MAG: type II toxin-antitoxin system RelE/ParE family toxin [Bacteroidota bacterium]|nr:type II toxin-antitoxin system RelE/ParE family toxin [Bacteroidota bacterium]
MFPSIIKDQAAEDIQEAYEYLESKEKDLGEKLLKRIEEYLEIIESNPYIFKEGYKKVRQIRVKPFQYILRYKIYKGFVGVIQLYHGRQHPNKRVYK